MAGLFRRRVIVKPPLPTLEFIGVRGSSSNTTTYNFSSVSIGAAHPKRRVFLCIVWRSSTGAGRTVSSATINGVSATVHAATSTSGQGNEEGTNIISAPVPTGTSVNVSITMSGECFDLDFGVYRATNLKDSTPFDTAENNNTTGATMSLDIPSEGIAIGNGNTDNPGTATTWTGLTEDYDQAGAGSEYRLTGASASRMSSEAGRSVRSSASRSSSCLSWR